MAHPLFTAEHEMLRRSIRAFVEKEITPHVAALTLCRESVRQIAEKISRLEQGRPVEGVIDAARGY